MPKREIDYHKTYFYKIFEKKSLYKGVFIGYTTNFIQRKYFYKQNCNKYKNSDSKTDLYNIINSYGGWENWDISVLEIKNCDSQQ